MNKYLITGASGFLGSAIVSHIGKNNMVTIGRSPGADIQFDLTAAVPKLPYADIVIHCAGKAHSVPKTALEKKEFYDVNVVGTSNLLTGLETSMKFPKCFVFISTVAVYGLDSGILINEEMPLNAREAYGKSKLEAERLVLNWGTLNDVKVSILRLPLIAGTNPPGNLNSMIRSINDGYYFNVAGGHARKSIVLASDVASIIPHAADIGGIYNLTDRRHPSFSELARLIAHQLNKKEPSNIPLWLATAIGFLGDFIGSKAPLNSNKLRKISSSLTFDDSKAFRNLNWVPTSVLKGFIVK